MLTVNKIKMSKVLSVIIPVYNEENTILKILNELETPTIVIGRGNQSADKFMEITGSPVVTGGLEMFLSSKPNKCTHAIIAVGVSTLLKKKSALGQNVIIQSIGQNSGLIVAGAIFTIPALYILNLQAEFYQIFLASAFAEVFVFM